ncbi:glycogen/starch synthase [Shewanella sp.]|nr:glycogen/starch synthase [Shewanella sp.]
MDNKAQTLTTGKQTKPRVLMLAAENGALAGAKVGGMADVIRDLPLALATHQIAVDIAMPCYGFLVPVAGAHWLCELSVNFAGREEKVTVHKAKHPDLKDSNCYLFSHPLLNGRTAIYSQGEPSRPFAVDASKFALFNLAVATALAMGLTNTNSRPGNASQPVITPAPDIVHLHDWHCGFFALLRAFEPRFKALKNLRCVLSIHNLAMQGIRPLSGDLSSLSAWFPRLFSQLSSTQLAAIIDPRYPHCVNPLRAGIVLSDIVHVVSPSYAKEILQPSDLARGFFGGEGLEHDLRERLNKQQLVGILNGCMYANNGELNSELNSVEPAGNTPQSGWKALLQQAQSAILGWQVGKEQLSSQHFVAHARLQQWQQQKEASLLMTSVGRLTDQKMMILRYRFPANAPERCNRGKTVLQVLLEGLAALVPNGKFLMLGSGDQQISREFADVGAQQSNFVFLEGYDEPLSSALYQQGSLFLMPSSFEPCGISQMLAMRAGQLCLVNRIGGLKDTVTHMENGFVFEGENVQAQAQALIATFEAAIALYGSAHWHTMVKQAKQQRVDWATQAGHYVKALYCQQHGTI